MEPTETLTARLTADERRLVQLIGGHLNRILMGNFDAVPMSDRLDELGILFNMVARTAQELRRSRELELQHRRELEERIAELQAAHERQSELLVRQLHELAASHEQQARLLATVRELSSPILAVHPHVLLVPLIGALDLARVEQTMGALLPALSAARARVVILDVTGVPTLDVDIAERLLRGARSVSLLGAQAILSGVSPALAVTAVRHSIDLTLLHPCGRLADALALALDMMGERQPQVTRVTGQILGVDGGVTAG